MDLASNINSIRDRIQTAATKVGRNPKEIELVAVSKRVESKRIIDALDLGLYTFGENYAQEFRDKYKQLEQEDDKEINWHFIGQLQKNKVKYIAGKVELIHSLDSLSVANEINKRSQSLGIKTSVLIEVDTGGEESKGGVSPSNLEEFLDNLDELDSIKVNGLMTMPPYFDDIELSRPYFVKLRNLREKLSNSYPQIKELSMGMSGDFEVAIQEGATIIRVGTAIFGERDK
ncbi:MAG: YggS family pyridoxal phosphate-dependent enzyme [Thermodesulfobacteriota bacterium]